MRQAGLVIQQTINLWCRQMKVQYLYIMHGMAALKLPFLEKQTRTDRMIFVLRFWYMETPREIAKHMGLKEKNVYNTLYQMRKRFRVYWEQSGKEDTVYEKA